MDKNNSTEEKVGLENSNSENSELNNGEKLIVAVLFFVLIIFLSSKYQQDATVKTVNNLSNQEQSNTIKTSTGFDVLDPQDKTRIEEIMGGVIQNTITITPELKKEIRGILTKYNVSESDMDYFKKYGPAVAVVYQKLFFEDVLKTISLGVPFKSNDRQSFEKIALSKKLVTAERIKQNEETMLLIAKHLPIVGLDGQEVVFTEDMAKKTIADIDLIGERLSSLFQF